jgi:hypothetical protein
MGRKIIYNPEKDYDLPEYDLLTLLFGESPTSCPTR